MIVGSDAQHNVATCVKQIGYYFAIASRRLNLINRNQCYWVGFVTRMLYKDMC